MKRLISAARGVKVTLWVKGIIAFTMLVMYLAVIVLVMSREREKLLEMVAQSEAISAQERVISRANIALAHSVFRLQDRFYTADAIPPIEEVMLDMEIVHGSVAALLPQFPQLAKYFQRIHANADDLRDVPSRANLMALFKNQEELGAQFNEVIRNLRERRARLANDYRVAYDSVTTIAVFMGLLGVLTFGTVMVLFFTRLARDIKKLEAHTLCVVTSYRNDPLKVTRHDEVGGLMEAINRMQHELYSRDRQLEVARQQRFHQEKMGAIGSLAVGVAHEINNPIAAITGIAQTIRDTKQSCGCTGAACQPELILPHAARIAAITRQLATLTRPHSQSPELMNLNDTVRGTCGFIIYDKRFRGIDLALDLDDQLPAVELVVDYITQVLMNLLLNAADALEEVSDRKRWIRVATRANGSTVGLSVIDNGCGMDSTVLAQAFDELFTTKPRGKGQGVGLFLCKMLIEQCGGRIELESAPGKGTTARLALPVSYKQRLAT